MTDQQRRDWEAAHKELSERKAAARGTEWPSVRLSTAEDILNPAGDAAEATQAVVKRRKIGSHVDNKRQAQSPPAQSSRRYSACHKLTLSALELQTVQNCVARWSVPDMVSWS